MNFEDKLFSLGVATYMTDVITLIPVTAQTTFQIGKILQQDIGYIYGISSYADSTDETGTALPSTTQMQNLWFQAINGSTLFMQNWRMDDLLNVFAGTPEVRNAHYRRVSIPRFDLSKSQFVNPTGINSGAGNINIHLKLWYIKQADWQLIADEINCGIMVRKAKLKEALAAHKK